MKIENSGKPATPSSSNAAAKARTQGPATAPQSSANPASAGNTEATLSGAQGLGSVLASSPIVDAARVAEIKQAIAEGRFQVNAERIADGLLQSVHEMLSSSR